MNLKIPVLFLIFNRIETTQEVFNVIKDQKPNVLFIASDGPRENVIHEEMICKQIREWILENITWECEVKTLFRVTNLGCGRAVSEAITWFFNNVDEGIIIEDDCLPCESFFSFCSENLEKYRYDHRISIISGNNFQLKQTIKNGFDYYFSAFPSTWGWATWKRTWDGYDLIMRDWSKTLIRRSVLSYLNFETKFNSYWGQIFSDFAKGKGSNTWDFQFYFHCMKRKQLAIIPKVNLVSNIGFGNSATHTTDKQSNIANLPTYELEFPLRHPEKIDRNYEADLFVQMLLFGEADQISPVRQFKRWLKKRIHIPKM